MPHDELSGASGLVDDRLAVSGFARDLKRSPALSSRVLVKGDNKGVWFATDNRDEMFAVDERCAGDTTWRKSESVVCYKISLPSQGPGLDVEAKKVARRSYDVHASFVDGRRRPGPMA